MQTASSLPGANPSRGCKGPEETPLRETRDCIIDKNERRKLFYTGGARQCERGRSCVGRLIVNNAGLGRPRLLEDAQTRKGGIYEYEFLKFSLKNLNLMLKEILEFFETFKISLKRLRKIFRIPVRVLL